MGDLDTTGAMGRSPDSSVRILSLKVTPDPDGQRVRFHASLSPSQTAATLEAEIRRPDGSLVSSAVIVGAEGPEVEFLLHLKEKGNAGDFVARLILEAGDLGTQEIFETRFGIPAEGTYY